MKFSHASFIDGYISETRVLIEQKGADTDPKKGYKQFGGSMLTPLRSDPPEIVRREDLEKEFSRLQFFS